MFPFSNQHTAYFNVAAHHHIALKTMLFIGCETLYCRRVCRAHTVTNSVWGTIITSWRSTLVAPCRGTLSVSTGKDVWNILKYALVKVERYCISRDLVEQFCEVSYYSSLTSSLPGLCAMGLPFYMFMLWGEDYWRSGILCHLLVFCMLAFILGVIYLSCTSSPALLSCFALSSDGAGGSFFFLCNTYPSLSSRVWSWVVNVRI
jgi:hypothetical protein